MRALKIRRASHEINKIIIFETFYCIEDYPKIPKYWQSLLLFRAQLTTALFIDITISYSKMTPATNRTWSRIIKYPIDTALDIKISSTVVRIKPDSF